MKQYRRIKDELTVAQEDDLVLFRRRIVMPRAYQNISVKLAHVGHLGVNKTKALLRTKLFFFGMDALVEKEIGQCLSCQATTKKKTQQPLNIMLIPEEVWEKVNVDYLGPFPNGQYIFVAIDQRSRFPEVEFTNSTSARKLINTLDRIFSTYGIPNVIVSVNGPPFKSHEIKEYLQLKGVQHRRIQPLWPQANAYAEKFMTSLNKIVRAAFIEGKDWKRETYNFFFIAYRNSPHSTTKEPPAEMMFQRKLRHMLPSATTKINTDLHRQGDQRDEDAKKKAKLYTENRHHA